MASLDDRFICTSDVDSYFVDNASGLPMSGGIVTFYSDVNRTVLKPVYQLTGTPGNYTYAPLNNPITLSSSGTYQDALGNNIAVYYYPFTGLPSDMGGAGTGVQELYYIVVKNSGYVPQLTRQGWPQAAGNGTGPDNTGNELINFIPNGQFLANNNAIAGLAPNVEPYTQYMEGTETVNAQPIAQGGWNFVYTASTMATFANSFTQIPNSGGFTGINSYPRYIFNFQCLSIGNTPTTRDLRIQWPDVYKFSSGVLNGVYPTYDFFFNARSNDGNTYQFTLNQIYYLGGGQAPIVIPIATLSIGPAMSFVNYNYPMTFPTPAGTLSGNNDDYVALSLRGPNTPWNVSFTDFVLYEGDVALTSFPTDTNAEMLSQGVAGWMPTPNNNGNDLGLPLVLTPQGMTFDHTQVGKIVTSLNTTPQAGELAMDGSVYSFTGYSALGIPYSRLGNFLVANAPVTAATPIYPAGSVPLMGTGANFVTIGGVTSHATEFQLVNNTAGGADPVASGAISNTSGSNPTYILTVNTVPTAGYYWTFTGYSSDGPTSLVYNVWYTVNGVGTAPATPTGANILVALVTADTTATTVTKTQIAINTYQFAIFNMAGYFLRAYDPSGINDGDYNTRTIAALGLTGHDLGSTELAAFLSHTHSTSLGGFIGPTGAMSGGSGTSWNSVPNTTATGGSETRPINFAVNYFIKY